MGRRILLVAGMLGAVGLFLPAGSIAGRSSTHRVKPFALHFRWTLLTGRMQSFDLDAPYVYLTYSEPPGSGLLLDDRTGRMTTVTPPGADPMCSVNDALAALQGPWLVFTCPSDTLELYSLAAHSWTQVSYAAHEAQICGPPDSSLYCDFFPTAAGAQWIEFNLSYSAPMCGCASTEYFENVFTGAWRRTRPANPSVSALDKPTLPGINSGTMIDLNSPSLVAPVCSPIRLPDHGALIQTPEPVTAVSPVTFYGGFAVVGKPFATGPFYLQRCGRRLKEPISLPESGSARLVVLDGSGAGLELATRRPVTFRLPRPERSPTPAGLPGGGTYPYALAVGANHMFAVGSNLLWEATLPRSLRADG